MGSPRRKYRANGRWFRSLVGLVDDSSRDLAASMGVYTNPASPACRGPRVNNEGLRGVGVNACEWQTPPRQAFQGVDNRTIQRAAQRAAQGDLLESDLPTANGGVAASPLGWLSLKNAPGIGYGG